MDKIILKKPIQINGEEVKELTYDIEEITSDLYLQALAKKTVPVSGRPTGAVAEIDAGLHLTIGMAAIIAVNPAYDFDDLKGRDIASIMKVGRSFFTASENSEEENSQQNNSESGSATTEESTTPPSES